ncbi:hypothetical protein [Streptomyces brevispora]|uniref:O-antigen/teichoic acid export membrane protein n=1 Tax=Streptomyces brevispora TaxID=887462 RepID=A0ABZ1FX70_9ACTN|nr:hypothetical protein [Streptomyces brevispora]WSC12220.1 hypothetical protein OIE64_04760 [Streptomyces brevispora]
MKKAASARAAWGLIDQVLSSASNFFVSGLAAHSLAPGEFGAFALAFAVYLLLLGVSRSLCTEPLAIRYTAQEQAVFDAGARRAVGSVTVLSLLLGGVCLAAGLLIGGSVGGALVALGVVTPALLVQDAWRYVFFASGRVRSAVLNDFVWVLAQVGLFGLMAGGALPRSGPIMIVVWGVGAGLGAVLGLRQSRLVPAWSGLPGWLREHSDLGGRFAGEFIAAAGAVHLVSFGIGATAGLAAAGSIRGALLVFGPLSVILMAAGVVLLPEFVRNTRLSVDVLARNARAASWVLLALSVVWGLVCLATPASIGQRLLGQNWPGVRSVLPQIALMMCGTGVSVGATLGLRALGAARRSLRARLSIIPVTIVGGVLGAALWDAAGAATGFAVASITGGFIWWRHFRAAVAEWHLTAEIQSMNPADIDTPQVESPTP